MPIIHATRARAQLKTLSHASPPPPPPPPSSFQAFADDRGIPFLETSAKSSNNVEKAFLTMAGEIKNRMAMVPQAEDNKSTVSVGRSVEVGAKQSGGCC